jgi:hypothetical protein
MSTLRRQTPTPDGEDQRTTSLADGSDPSLAIGAVREDIRQTLRMGWIDPALDSMAAHPVFFTAAWSAMRPNVGKSFLVLARALRAEAAEAVRASVDLPDLRKQLMETLSDEEMSRIEECVKAAHLSTAKIQIVIHGFYRAVRRDRVRGTGREESPIRRGIPDWQRWMAFQPAPDGSQALLDRAGEAFGVPVSPAPVRLLARWPAVLEAAWGHVDRHRASEAWGAGGSRLRRAVLAGIESLPHPIELQWPALRVRGFGDAERTELTELLASYDSAMPAQTLTAAFLWAAFGSPEIGSEA